MLRFKTMRICLVKTDDREQYHGRLNAKYTTHDEAPKRAEKRIT
jgi:hypothetical protein